jgi:hypothetical protein
MMKMNEVLRRARCAAILALTFVTGGVSCAWAAGIHPSTKHHVPGAAALSLRGPLSGLAAHDGSKFAAHPLIVGLRGTLSSTDRTAIVMSANLRTSLPVNDFIAAGAVPAVAVEPLASDRRCLAEAMYYEARGEGTDGQMAIAEVIFHRMHARGYPGSICGVVYQGANGRGACQFSFACNGEMIHPRTPGAWARADRLAARILGGLIALGNITGGAIAFHASDVEPRWSSSLERTVQIGNHIFYRPLARTRAS